VTRKKPAPSAYTGPKQDTFVQLPLANNGGNLVHQVNNADLRDLNDLVLPPQAREAVDRVLTENRKADELAKHGLRANNRLLLCGPPGCGKTVTAGAIAKALGLPLIHTRMDAVVVSYLGDTGKNIRKVFDVARDQRVVLFLDEVDSIARSRDGKDEGEIKRVTNMLLTMLEEMRGPSLVICATNHEVALDRAMWRRFDEVVMFPMPTTDEAISLLRTTIAWSLYSGDGDLAEDAIVRAMEHKERPALDGMSFADVERIATDAAKSSILTNSGDVVFSLVSAIKRQRERMVLTGKVS
jgi:SpoVK/Ycf46/Vps4 family AAA+-type ATPase